jgi:hypothetical protein
LSGTPARGGVIEPGAAKASLGRSKINRALMAILKEINVSARSFIALS